MTTSTKLRRPFAAAAVAATLSFAATPALAAEDAAATEDGAATVEEEAGKITMAETPRDRVGLIMLTALGAMAIGGGITAARQLGGKRPAADGEFRWR